jgi:multidrug resistance efflux pump
MASRAERMPRSSSSLKIRKAVKHLKAMPMVDRIQLLVEAKLMSQEEADQAKHKLRDANESVNQSFPRT